MTKPILGILAKSLLETGKDEHGVSWPLIFKGFGDQKLPGYAYLLIPFVAVFDLSVTTIRLPSALLGASMVLLGYLLAKKSGFSKTVALSLSVIIAISPWTFFLSRIGFESNLALWFWFLGLLGLVNILKNQTVHWSISIATGLSLAATWYSYIAYRPVTLGLLICITLLSLWYAKWKVTNQVRSLFIVAGILILGVLPLFHPSVTQANTARLKQVGLMSDPHQAVIIDEYRTFCDEQLPLGLCSLFWNKGTVTIQQLVTRFFTTYSPEYLSTKGEPNEKFLTVQGFGQVVWPIYLLFIVGLIKIALKSKKSLLEWLVIVGLVVSPLPGIIAGEPQKVRMSAMVPFVLLSTSYGLGYLFQWMNVLLAKSNLHRVLAVSIVTTLTLVTLGWSGWYFLDYFTVHTVKNDYMYQSFVRDLFVETEKLAPNQLIYIKPFFSDPTMFYAFYTKMDPKEYQQQAILGPLEGSGFQHTIAIDKVKVWDTDLLSIACKVVATNTSAVYISNTQEPSAVSLTTFKSANGSLTYAYVYDALLYGKQQVMNCNDIPAAQRQQIYNEYLLSITPQ